jgi:hypothetical protein
LALQPVQLHGVPPGHIRAQGNRLFAPGLAIDFRGHRLGPTLANVGHHHPCAFLGKELGRRFA